MSARRLLATALAFLALSALAAVPEWTPTRAFRTFSKSSWRGLPQSSVVALAQDRDGILWIGTLDGTATYDGRTITPVAAVPAAPLRGIIAGIVARKAGGVYVASQAGVHVYDGGMWSLLATKHGPASIAEGRDGTLWMADTSGALYTLEQGGRWKEHPEVNGAIAVAAAPDGSMWAATQHGAVRIDGNRISTVDGLPSAPAALLVASDGRIWAATVGCTIHWTRGAGDVWHQVAFTPWPRGAFRCLAEDRRGRIWGGSYGGHVAFGTATTPWTVWDETNGPFSGGVMSIMGDREGSVWFGINAVGMIQWIGEGWSHRLTVDPANPGRNSFAAFGLARGAVAGTFDVSVFSAGVLRLGPGPKWQQIAAPEGITEDVRAVAEPAPGTMYVGARFGVFESRNGSKFTQVVKLPTGFVMGIFESPDHKWYAASTSKGVFVRDPNGWREATEINSALTNMHVRGMTWTRNGDLWVSTLRGITVFHAGGTAEQLTSSNNRAIPESVNAVIELPNGDIWAGGTGGIAVRHGKEWRRVGESSGIPGQTIYSFALGHHGEVWAGGSAGVGKFENDRWTVWDSREGLLQEECNLNGLIVDDDGGIWVSTMAGLGHFDPSIKPLSHPPLTLIWRTPPPRELPRGERALHLRWTAPFLGEHPVQYRVRVPRLHNDWGARRPRIISTSRTSARASGASKSRRASKANAIGRRPSRSTSPSRRSGTRRFPRASAGSCCSR